MAKKLMTWKTKGMNRDLSVSAFNPEFAFENINLRLSTNDGNTMLSWVNEKGTMPLKIYEEVDGQATETEVTFQGTPVGTAVLNNFLILFLKGSSEYIYRLRYVDDSKTSMMAFTLYSGPGLGLSIDHPLETLASYESENVQKVYWVDGKNQPRMINIMDSTTRYGGTPKKRYDFVPTLNLREGVSVTKLFGTGGMFAPGVIQYCFTYYNKYGQESNIFHTTHLHYISYVDRGASPEDKVDNAFKITVENLDSDNFDYLRIYSIQRTSLNAEPICKRVQDIEISNLTTVSYTDTGTSGDSIDPRELLYKNREPFIAGTMEQKDGTLFFGDIRLLRPSLKNKVDSSIVDFKSTIEPTTRGLYPKQDSTGSYAYANQLSADRPCGGFKSGDTYRLGIQFQHESGKWSEPIDLGNFSMTNRYPEDSGSYVVLQGFYGSLSTGLAGMLRNLGYLKARPLVVFPEMQDRSVVCQAVANPTLWTQKHHDDKDLNAQSSWFFRPNMPSGFDSGITNIPTSTGVLPYTSKDRSFNPSNIRTVEVQGEFSTDNKFNVSWDTLTLHSPDIEFDDQLSTMDFTSSMQLYKVAEASFQKTFSDIDIQTETPTISNGGGGFEHRSFISSGAKGIIAGLFYDDYVVDDKSSDYLRDYDQEPFSAKWMVYPWQRNGSLNNDINRPANLGVSSAILKKKVISNLRYATTTNWDTTQCILTSAPKLFSSDEISVLKFEDNIYQGNVDTLLMPDEADGDYMAFSGTDATSGVQFDSNINFKTYSTNETASENNGLWKWILPNWKYDVDGSGGDHIGDNFVDLVIKKGAVRMKYKSTPHIVVQGSVSDTLGGNCLPVVELRKTVTSPFGGGTDDALKAYHWLPCGPEASLNMYGVNIPVYFLYGDTYYQRYDCLKTYPFTPEDPNQIVEIGSFMLETRINIDGRYDRNRGQVNNLNMTPRNFNLINPVYSQKDNFFTYRILPDDYYNNVDFPNQITWSLTKTPGADVDMWTNITFANTLEMDGDKGKVRKLIRQNNQLLCFQDQGISQILYNENVQISTANGVPVEIANSDKVQGKRYLSNTIGCSNKWSMVNTPTGIYFMDSNEKNIYLLGDNGLASISQQGGFNAWAKKNIPSASIEWTPVFPADSSDKTPFMACYDRQNQDVLWINGSTALAWSERLGTFTSFYDYGNTPFFCNLGDTGLWITQEGKLWKHQSGDYCSFFNRNKPFSMTLIGNPEPQMDKTFTNMEFRASVSGEGTGRDTKGNDGIDTFDNTFDDTFHPDNGGGEVIPAKYTPYIPVDYMEVWDEYQHGIAHLGIRNGRSAYKHHEGNSSSLQRKFRMWRCDIPRNNYPMERDAYGQFIPENDSERGIYRKAMKPMDRMRNPWLYIKLQKNAAEDDDVLHKVELHDFVMTYFT